MSVDDSISSVNDEVDKITQLPNEICDLALKEIIQNNINDEEYEIAYSAGSGKGDNYIGIVYRVEVKSANKNFNIIAKLPPQDHARREQFFVRPCFLRESQFYDDVQPIYKKFQEDKGIDLEKEGFNQIPFCYKSMTEDPNEALFFEDLKSGGFEMYDRFENLTKEHVLLTMQVLGKMHAVFYAIKDQQPELIAEFREIVDIFMQRRDDPNMTIWFDTMKNQARSSIDNCDKALIEKVENLFKDSFYELISSCISGEDAEPYSILCHGDCWNNNMMYRYDENKKPVDIRLLDFQLLRYSSPVCDLMYYIFGCTTRELRIEHYQEFLDVYYETLSSYVERLGSSAEKVFPRHAFDDHLKRFGKFGLLMGICVIPIFTTKASEIPDMDEMAKKFQESADNGTKFELDNFMDFSKMSSANTCNERMKDVFEDMYNLGYI